MLAMKKNKTKFTADVSLDAVDAEADPEFMLSAIWAKLAAWKNKTKMATAEAADDEILLSMLYNKLARKNLTAWKTKMAASEDAAADEVADVETNEYFMHRLNKTAIASTIATKWNKVRG